MSLLSACWPSTLELLFRRTRTALGIRFSNAARLNCPCLTASSSEVFSTSHCVQSSYTHCHLAGSENRPTERDVRPSPSRLETQLENRLFGEPSLFRPNSRPPFS